MKSVREVAVEEFNKVKENIAGGEVMAWHIWKRAFDHAARSLTPEMLKNPKKQENNA